MSGYHRKFCLETHMGRGSKDAPGLMLGLDVGSCWGTVIDYPDKGVSRVRDYMEKRNGNLLLCSKMAIYATGGKS